LEGFGSGAFCAPAEQAAANSATAARQTIRFGERYSIGKSPQTMQMLFSPFHKRQDESFN
jgi:hypothetical protein